MLSGILAGIFWALETVVLGIALAASPFVSSEEALFLAPFVATFLHDACSSLYMLIFNVARGSSRELFGIFKSKNLPWLILASAIGGPVGMTGYVMAVNFMGASVGAVASAIYPAIGTALAFFFLKEKVKWYQWLFLFFTLLGVLGISYSPALTLSNVWLGLLGALMCAFGWGIEAVILAKCLKSDEIKSEYALWARQTTSALVYGALIIPILGGVRFTASLFVGEGIATLPTVALAALFATLSYLCYYRAIASLGAARAMALNITYTAWAIVFTVLILRDTSVLNPTTLLCALVVLVCGIFAAQNLSSLFSRKRKDEDISDGRQ
ncbi:MAG: DMT family transporter [Clostridia bacterium]|nr:DMT family transporter [Clostridia bacterium]MBP3582686.1 DMT family transporter [Clostridia bacterium]